MWINGENTVLCSSHRGLKSLPHANTTLEKSDEFKRVLLAFIDFEKVFDTSKKLAFLNPRCHIVVRNILLQKCRYKNPKS